MTTTRTKTPPKLTVDQGIELGDDLIRELAQHVGDKDALNAVFRRWADVLGSDWLALVALAALRSTFAECLTPTPGDQVPPNRLALIPPNERKTA